ncbi:MAG: N-formylglutamate amidohydrolase [Rhizobiales bacterium]|nr:N-formylglutamate amidohydrolase [Hyphomicrobiales bacterium]MBA69692.1 N-formylglutamate amidohydrolase [Hyphomicrobiales bacterium]
MLQTGTINAKADERLLGPKDPAPFDIVNGEGSSRVVLLCEHAGRQVPRRLGDLGLPKSEYERHIAYDIGAEGVARNLSVALDAPLILQRYSRLVVDCNRAFESSDCMPATSDTTAIPANQALSEAERVARYEEIHVPFHREVSRVLDSHGRRHRTALISVHSFTPRLLKDGIARPWQFGLLFNRDDRLARKLMAAIIDLDGTVNAAFNEPYTGNDLTDYAIPVHGEKRGIEHVLIEIRNDLIAEPEGQARWSKFLAAAIRTAVSREEGVKNAG